MISNLRNEMENEKLIFDQSKQKDLQSKNEEFKQLESTIVELRQNLRQKMADKKYSKQVKRTTRFSDYFQVTNDLAKTKSLDEALETLVKITTSTIGAERGTIFLNDASTGELYSRIAQGNFRREIRILNTKKELQDVCFRIKE